MKKLLLLFGLLGTITINAQEADCDQYVTTTTDKVTGQSYTHSNEDFILTNSDGLEALNIIILKRANGSIAFSLRVLSEVTCIDDKSKMNILFRDGSRLELVNDGKFNCDGRYIQCFGGLCGKKRHLKKMATLEIETIRIGTLNSFVQFDLTNEESLQLLNVFKCIS